MDCAQRQLCVVVGVRNCSFFNRAKALAKELENVNTFCSSVTYTFSSMQKFKQFCADKDAPIRTSPLIFLLCFKNKKRTLKWIGGYSELTMLDLRHMRPGTQLQYAGAFGIEFLHHHALYIGNDQVIHFSGGHNDLDKRNATVVLESLTKFVNDVANTKCTFVKRHKQRMSDDDGDAVVKRCLELVGTKGYNVMSNNCEDLVEYCMTGHRRSKQREQMIGKLTHQLADYAIKASRAGNGKDRWRQILQLQQRFKSERLI